MLEDLNEEEKEWVVPVWEAWWRAGELVRWGRWGGRGHWA